jgi:hypothetical protein
VIQKSVREADIFIACLSSVAATKRGYIQKETRMALEAALRQPQGAIFIVPVQLEECDIPEDLVKYHAMGWSGPEDRDMLLKAIASEVASRTKRGSSLTG